MFSTHCVWPEGKPFYLDGEHALQWLNVFEYIDISKYENKDMVEEEACDWEEIQFD